MAETSVIARLGEENYKTMISYGNFELHADEPIDLGGQNTAPHPKAYLHSALASCVAITLRMYSDRKQWSVGDISVEIEEIIQENDEVVLKKHISFSAPITEDQEKRLLLIAEKCPVAKMLKTGVSQTAEINSRRA